MLEGLPKKLRWEYKRTDDPARGVEELTDPHASYETAGVEVERDAGRQALESIRDAVDDRARDHHVMAVVVGVEPYIEADVFCRHTYEDPLQQVLHVEVIVVPGDMIEPVVPAEKRIEEHLFDEEEEDADA